MEKIKKLLIEFNEKKIPQRFERDYNYSLLDTNKILSFVGVRRSGKTSYLYQLMNFLKNNNVSKNNIIYINFEDDRLFPLEGGELDSIIPTFKEIFEYETNKPIYLFLDEIQNIPNWSKWVRRIHDREENIKLIITGSSSKLLSREIATELRGRTISREVFPFSFKEYLDFKNQDYVLENIYYSSKKPQILKYFNQYLSNGGFPETINDEENSQEILMEYFSAIFYKDLVERHNISSTKMFEDFLKLLVQNIGNVSSLTNHEKQLKRIGHKVSKSTLSEYVEYAQEAYFLFQVPIFSYKIKNQLAYPKKIYGVDNGLINSITFKLIEEKSILLENIVFLHLQKLNKEIFYYKTSNDLEVDFLVKEDVNLENLIQVSVSIKDEKTRQREINALLKAMDEIEIKKSQIITIDEKETIEIENKIIEVIPIYEYLLKQYL